MSNPKLFRIADKAVKDYRMLNKNDKLLVAVSGGKDSMALAEYLAFRRKRTDFSLTALHIYTELEKANLTSMKNFFQLWDLDYVIKKIEVFARLKKGQKMNCWWCSSQRRIELLNFALENGFNKIAFGHHLDDILETILMNIFNRGKTFGMPPILKLRKFPVTIIRPFALADEQIIKSHASRQGYISVTCTCDYQSKSARKAARAKLENLTDNNYNKKLKFFNALKEKNILHEYLP